MTQNNAVIGDQVDQTNLYQANSDNPDNLKFRIYPKDFPKNTISYLSTLFMSANSNSFIKSINNDEQGPNIPGIYVGTEYNFSTNKKYVTVSDHQLPFCSRILTDVIIECGNKTFFCESLALASKSGLFKKLIMDYRINYQNRFQLVSNAHEKMSNSFRYFGKHIVIEVDECFTNVIGNVLEWFHTGRLIVPGKNSYFNPKNGKIDEIPEIFNLIKFCKTIKMDFGDKVLKMEEFQEKLMKVTDLASWFAKTGENKKLVEEFMKENGTVSLVKLKKSTLQHMSNAGYLDPSQLEILDKQTKNPKPNRHQKWSQGRNTFLKKVITLSDMSEKIKTNYDYGEKELQTARERNNGENLINGPKLAKEGHILLNFPEKFSQQFSDFVADLYKYANTDYENSNGVIDGQDIKNRIQEARLLSNVIISYDSINSDKVHQIYGFSTLLCKSSYFTNLLAQDRWSFHQNIQNLPRSENDLNIAQTHFTVLKLTIDFKNIKFYSTLGAYFRYLHIGKFLVESSCATDKFCIKNILKAIKGIQVEQKMSNVVLQKLAKEYLTVHDLPRESDSNNDDLSLSSNLNFPQLEIGENRHIYRIKMEDLSDEVKMAYKLKLAEVKDQKIEILQDIQRKRKRSGPKVEINKAPKNVWQPPNSKQGQMPDWVPVNMQQSATPGFLKIQKQ